MIPRSPGLSPLKGFASSGLKLKDVGMASKVVEEAPPPVPPVPLEFKNDVGKVKTQVEKLDADQGEDEEADTEEPKRPRSRFGAPVVEGRQREPRGRSGTIRARVNATEANSLDEGANDEDSLFDSYYTSELASPVLVRKSTSTGKGANVEALAAGGGHLCQGL